MISCLFVPHEVHNMCAGLFYRSIQDFQFNVQRLYIEDQPDFRHVLSMVAYSSYVTFIGLFIIPDTCNRLQFFFDGFYRSRRIVGDSSPEGGHVRFDHAVFVRILLQDY